MPAPGEIDHVLQGLESLPEKYQQEPQVRYLSVYLREANAEERVVQALIAELLAWWRDSATLDFVLDDIIGPLLDQPRPDGFSNAQYKFILLARTRVRRSANTLNDVLRVVEFLAKGGGFIVQPVVPRAYTVIFFDLGLTDQEQGLYEKMLLDTIGQVDFLDLRFLSSGTALYDSAVQVYDLSLYA